MSVILRLGAVHDVGSHKDGGTDTESVDGSGTQEEYYQPHSTYPGCFGLPYQDHNYGQPPPPTPPPSPPPIITPPTIIDKINGHIEIEEVTTTTTTTVSSIDVPPEKEIWVEDDSVTRCICNFTHDDGYMICCDKCSVWQHIDCMAVDRNNIPDSYFCELCEPRILDVERAREIQLRKKEFLITVVADSSATDTDPEEATNRQMSQLLADKKGKTKKKTKLKNKIDLKPKKNKKDKKDVKKEKENKDVLKKPLKLQLKFPTIKETNRKQHKNKMNKKSGLQLMINENAQDPWDSTYSPWVDKYEDAIYNEYSQDLLEVLSSLRVNGQHPGDVSPFKRQLRDQLCHVTDVTKNRKGLEASETIGESQAIIEYRGKVMLKHQIDRDDFFKHFNPFVLFYSKYNNVDLCIDATTYGNIARFIRRSCKANSEVRHVEDNGRLYFYVYATKVIPRGSEITIPYDYNYKECDYCVECACLRNNCAVSKSFKRKQNIKNRKEKTIKKPKLEVKSPLKSPVRSPIKSPLRSPVKKTPSVEEEPDHLDLAIKSEPLDLSLHKNTAEIQPQVIETEEAAIPHKERSSSFEESMQDHTKIGEQHDAKHKSREERKMDAIMKAFEKLEKREERRKEALARLDHSTKKPEAKKKEERSLSEKSQDKAKGKKADKAVVVAVKKEPEEIEIKEEPVKEIAEEESFKRETRSQKGKEKEVAESLIVLAKGPVKKESKPHKGKRAKKVASRRKSRMNTTSSEPALSVVDDTSDHSNFNTLPSCPSTPVFTAVDNSNSTSPFKFLKTKRHLMNEWLGEKSNDEMITSKVEPLEVAVPSDDDRFVTCLPSPRNTIERFRRNSQSSGTAGKSNAESSIGSAKKRWLRQAMWEAPPFKNGKVSPLGNSGGASPVPSSGGGGLPSPGASPPGVDFVTPLKKRRLARESCDQPATPPSTPLPSGVGIDASTTPEESAGVTTEQQINVYKPSIFPPTPVTPEDEQNKMLKKSEDFDRRESFSSSVSESVDSEMCDTSNHNSTRTSFDLSDNDSCKTSEEVTGGTGIDRSSVDLVGMVELSSEQTSKDTSNLSNCAVSSVGNSNNLNSDTDRNRISDAVCDSVEEGDALPDREIDSKDTEVDTEMSDSDAQVTSKNETMEFDSIVDSTQDQSGNEASDDSRRHSFDKLEICDSTSSKVLNRVNSESRVLSSSDQECSSGLSERVENSLVDSSTDKSAIQNCSTNKDVVLGISNSCQDDDSNTVSEGSMLSRIQNACTNSSARENVGSSSDKKIDSLSFGVSSSSELQDFSRQNGDSNVESSVQISDTLSVSSTGNMNQVDDGFVTSMTDAVDSSVSEGQMFSKHTEVESSESNEDNSVSRSFASLSETSEADTASQQGNEHLETVYQDDSNSISTSEELSSNSGLMPPEPAPAPAKKKVSLLEYRMRLKERTRDGSSSSSTHSSTHLSVSTSSSLSSSSSSSSSSSVKSSSSSSYPSSVSSSSALSSSFSPSSTLSRPSSTTPLSPNKNSYLHKNRLTSLPSLPLFDSSTSPTKESRHRFKSSSDLIRRNSSETKKKEKPLSLTERLRQEFGLEDSEEEDNSSNADGKVYHRKSHRAAISSTSACLHPPPPPPPPVHCHPSSCQPPPSSGLPNDQGQEAIPIQTQQLPQQSLNGPANQQHQGFQPVPPPHGSFHSPHITPPSVQHGQQQPSVHTPMQPELHMQRHLQPHLQSPANLMRTPSPGLAPPQGSGPPHHPPPPVGTPTKKIPSLLSIQTFPTASLQQINGGNASPLVSSSVPSQQQQTQIFQQGQQLYDQGMASNHQGTSQEQSIYNDQAPVQSSSGGPAQSFQPNSQSSQQSQPVFQQPPSGTNYTMMQSHQHNLPPSSVSNQYQEQSSPPSNGPVVHEYNHGYNGEEYGYNGVSEHQQYPHSPAQHHYRNHSSGHRKSKKFMKRKGNNHKQSYSDSGRHYDY